MEFHEGLTLALVFRRSRISIMKLRNPNEIVMPHPQFRLKVNLSRYFQDARRLCCILIDGAKMQRIEHIKEHISKLFNITDPFHLLLHDAEYLPPTEDVRILNENETIKVVPGTGVDNETTLTTPNTNTETINNKNSTKIGPCNGCAHNRVTKPVRTEYLNTGGTVDIPLTNIQPELTRNTENITTCHTQNEDMEMSIDSNITDISKLTENNDVKEFVAKRKRSRRRKSKNTRFHEQEFQELQEPESTISNLIVKDVNEATNPKKPKIIESVILPSGKHIRFSDAEDDEGNIVRKIVMHEKILSSPKSHVNDVSPSASLSNLLSLGRNPKVISFSKKPKITTFKVDTSDPLGNKSKYSNEIRENNNICMEDGLNNEKVKNVTQYSNLTDTEIEAFSVMTRTPSAGDIIAFKTLKIGQDYTPQISNFIIGEVVDFSAKSTTYFLRLIKGTEETEVPTGKFSVSEKEEVTCNFDNVPFNLMQMREPRLLH